MLSRRRFLTSASAAAPAFALRAQERPASAPQHCEEAPLPAPLLALRNRTGDIHPITTEEREARIDLARDLMKQHNLDAMVITGGASLEYYCGTRWGNSERLFAWVLPQAAAPFVICPQLERDHLAEALQRFPERETTLTYLWQDNEDPYIIFRRVLADGGLSTATLGFEEHMPYAFTHALADACPTVKWVPAMPVIAGQRSIKTDSELALMRLANQITLEVYRAVYLACGPGDPVSKFNSLVNRGYARCGVRGEVMCNTGPASASPHGSGRPQVIREHDIVLIDDGCQVDGYWSDISRTFVYGTPTDLQRKVFDTVHSAQSAALAAARPGATMKSVDDAARGIILQAGYGPEYAYFTHRLGHGIGLDMHEWPYLTGSNPQKLLPGMCFSDEPGIYIPGKFGVRLEDDMHITADGAQLFTPQSPSLTEPFSVAAISAPNDGGPARNGGTPELPPASAPKP